jgi:hypothetical protein
MCVSYQFGFEDRTCDEEEATEAYILVGRGDDDEFNEVKSMRANWYQKKWTYRISGTSIALHK